MKLKFWGYEWEPGGPYLAADLRESNDILLDGNALRARMEEDGYLLIRGLRERDLVLEARRQILEKLHARSALTAGATTSVRGNEDLRLLPGVQALVRCPAVMEFFERLLAGPAGTFDFQWLRVAGPGAESPIHSDIVFMGRGTERLYTCWTPLDDISLDMGPVVLCLGSHRAASLRSTYWSADVDRDLIEGFLSKDPLDTLERFGTRWSTTEFRAGDVLIFNMHILHASLANLSNRFRISVDARYQLASEPFDERWVGSPIPGHYNFWKPDAKLEPVAVSRARWGV
ncbi:MAG: phytanoyl-CoA dioxygenase family protein [Acidobacteria bacterium]|nr:phytanoyl-CoA dioxygenase family protein [Acidobacteriota bacterium]